MTSDQYVVIAETTLLIPAIRILAAFFGSQRCIAILAKWSERPTSPLADEDVLHVARAAAWVARRPMIGGRCLPQSIATYFLLRRRGVDANVVIGSVSSEGGRLLAHAWVEVAGVPLLEASDVRERLGSFGLQVPRLSAAL